MNREELKKLADKYQKKADTAFQNYPETGAPRYSGSFRRNEELVDALRMAANAADEHIAYISLKAEMANFASRAVAITQPYKTDEEKAEMTYALIRDILACGKQRGLIGGL